MDKHFERIGQGHGFVKCSNLSLYGPIAISIQHYYRHHHYHRHHHCHHRHHHRHHRVFLVLTGLCLARHREGERRSRQSLKLSLPLSSTVIHHHCQDL